MIGFDNIFNNRIQNLKKVHSIRNKYWELENNNLTTMKSPWLVLKQILWGEKS